MEFNLGVRHPLVAPLAALALGIVAAQFAFFSFQETLLSTLLLGLLAWVGLHHDAVRPGAVACLAGFLIAGAMLGSRRPPPDPLVITNVVQTADADLNDPVRLRGFVREPTEALDTADRFVLEVESVFANTPARGGVRVNVYRGSDDPPLELPYGRRVELLARLRELRNFNNPGSFDRVAYLNRRGIHLTASVRARTPIHTLGGQGGGRWQSWIWQVRTAAGKRLEVLLSQAQADDSPPAAILRAMLLGDRSTLDGETTTDFQRTGAYHALVISGLHVGVLALVISFLLRLVLVPPVGRALVTALAVAAYAALVGASLPVSRAAWMLSAYLAAGLLYRQRHALNVIAATALGFLIFDPDLLFDAGFQMSFLAVALIAGIAVPLLEAGVDPYRRSLRDLWNLDRDLHLPARVTEVRVSLRMWLEPLRTVMRLPRGLLSFAVTGFLRVVIWVVALFIVSLIIQVGLALPMAVHFHRVSWGGVSANLFVMPLLLVLVPLGLLALATEWTPLASASLYVAETIGDVVAWHAKNLPVDLRVPSPPLWLGVLFGICLFAWALSFGRRRLWSWTAAAATTASLALLIAHPFPPQLTPGRLELAALDVGQGESLFLALPDGRTVLVDGGGLPDFGGRIRRTLDIGETVVSPYLWSRSLRRLDVLAVSHPDADHFAGVPALLRNFEVGEMWVAADPSVEDYARIRPLLRSCGVPLVTLRQGEVKQLGQVAFEVLGPAPAPARKWSRNDQSLVLRARYGRHSFLLTGDIEERAESHLLERNVLSGAAVLKVAHHGSKTSSHQPFLERVRPTFAVISAGFRSPFGHPHPSVVKRLEQNGARVLRTDREGTISISTDAEKLFVSTYRHEQAAAPGRW